MGWCKNFNMPRRLNIAIFLIDDEKDMRFSLNAILRTSEIQNYTIFSDPVKLIEALHQGVQICVIDFNLKNEINGLMLMKQILAINSYCRCIIMSGYEDAEMIKAFLNNGAFRYLTKGEKNFDLNLINYIQQAADVVYDTFVFYTTVLSNLKKQTQELREVKNG